MLLASVSEESGNYSMGTAHYYPFIQLIQRHFNITYMLWDRFSKLIGNSFIFNIPGQHVMQPRVRALPKFEENLPPTHEPCYQQLFSSANKGEGGELYLCQHWQLFDNKLN